jgi:hypothetical protein
LTGIRPYLRYGNEAHQKAVVVRSERPRMLDHWPAWLQTVLTKSWCRDIAQRYTMEEAMEVIRCNTGRIMRKDILRVMDRNSYNNKRHSLSHFKEHAIQHQRRNSSEPRKENEQQQQQAASFNWRESLAHWRMCPAA